MVVADILKVGTRCHKPVTLVALDVFDRMTFMSTSPLVSPPAKPTSFLPSVHAGQQVVGRCAGPETLVPRTRGKHVVNMGRYGHARVSDLVAQTSHKPLLPFFAPALLQSAYPLSPYLALCCEACSAPCARN
jgi:hypothetical protein